jgi:hypothetical protein
LSGWNTSRRALAFISGSATEFAVTKTTPRDKLLTMPVDDTETTSSSELVQATAWDAPPTTWTVATSGSDSPIARFACCGVTETDRTPGGSGEELSLHERAAASAMSAAQRRPGNGMESGNELTTIV